MTTWIATTTGKVVGATSGPHSQNFGDVMFLFQSGNKYCVWNEIEDEVCSIESPTNLEEIYQTTRLGKGRLGDLNMKKA
ncbi:hypothetical protein BS17DRAFT_786808 [Gyrodon lividus]|nr:hypothetical protein BS17DRAFT_786808 [Gyrodon lividus]